jgi:hypothetical protein
MLLSAPNSGHASQLNIVRFAPIGDIERSLELKEVAHRGSIFWRYPTLGSAGPFCELNDFRADGCLKEPDPPKRAVSFYVSVSLVWSYGSLGFLSPFAGA